MERTGLPSVQLCRECLYLSRKYQSVHLQRCFRHRQPLRADDVISLSSTSPDRADQLPEANGASMPPQGQVSFFNDAKLVKPARQAATSSRARVNDASLVSPERGKAEVISVSFIWMALIDCVEVELARTQSDRF